MPVTIQAALLGVVQGLTEFLPVSSSAHLILARAFFGFDSEQFDLAVSIFGAMFAPRPFDVAKELVRVTRPGGRIIMGNWIPGDPTLVAQILRISP